MKYKLSIICFLLSLSISTTVAAQGRKGIVSGPMLGQVEFRTARIWVEVGSDARTVSIKYWKKSDPGSAKTRSFGNIPGGDFKPLQIELGGLDINTTYQYNIVLNGATTTSGGDFRTKELWQYRKQAPDFSFLTGSCFYVNEPVYDRKFTDIYNLDKPAVPYGQDSSIFNAMARTPAAFMLWLGDNWYTREVDYLSEWGLWYRASHDRSVPELQAFLKAMPHFAIWDDHDFGPNDADKSYVLKESSRKVFMSYWGNPAYGQEGQGIYTKISYADADFFLMDDRYFRSADDMSPVVNGRPNPEKRMWGEMQLAWLKSALLSSSAPFKFIVTGSQTLNPASPYDCLQHYPVEFNELTDFLTQERINGVLFLTGDRHHSEVIQYERQGTYKLYDITSSPITSGVGFVGDKERNNPARIPGTLVEKQNFTRISISGKGRERVLKVAFLGVKGDSLAEWSISEKELKTPQKINN